MAGLSAIAKKSFQRAGVYRLLNKLSPNGSVSVLRYHAVVADEDNTYTSPAIALSPEDFEAHVQFFTTYYTVLSLDYVIDCLQEDQPLPRNSVVFTFDDGYADNLFAARILHKYGATGTFYITTEPINRSCRLWLVDVTHLILRTQKREFSIIHNGKKHTHQLTDTAARWRAIRDVIRIVKSNNRAVRELVLKQLTDQIGERFLMKEIEDLVLTWDQVRQMRDMGMVIASHTTTHLNLPNADPQDAIAEITEAKKELEARIGQPVRHFSYPNSGPYEYFNERIRGYVISAGYDSATTSNTGFVDARSDRFALERVRTVPLLEEVVHGMEWDRIFSSSG